MSFVSYAGSVGVQVLILFLMMAVGFVGAKTRLITAQGASQLVDLLLYITTPGVILDAFVQVGYSVERLVSLGEMIGCVVLVHLIGIALALPIFRRDPAARKPVLRISAIFSNCGFMSLPLAEALFGAEGVFLVSMYVVMHNVIIWTVGVALFTPEKMSPKKAVLNPGMVAALIGLLLFFLGDRVPEVIARPIGYMGSMNTPLAMLVIGFFMADTALRFQKGDGRILLVCLLRLVVIPLLALGLLRLLPVPRTVFLACMLPASAPVGANITMFAEKFGGDTDCGARAISLSTFFSLLTMPVMLSLAQTVARV